MFQPKIIINNNCNLMCPYCVFDTFVNQPNDDISIDNFKEIINFIVSSECKNITIMGGEPMLHPNFAEILAIIINEKSIQNCKIYTNASLTEKYIDFFKNEKFSFKINCNSPILIGNEYKNLKDNIGLLYNLIEDKSRIELNINLSSYINDYSYIFDIFDEYPNLNILGINIALPNSKINIDKIDFMDFFDSQKDNLINILKELKRRKIKSFNGCAYIPVCRLTKEELNLILDMQNSGLIIRNFVAFTEKTCGISLVFTQDKQIARCCGLVKETKIPMNKFKDLKSSYLYFNNSIDIFSSVVCASKNCKKCMNRVLGQCNVACLIYKIKDILKLKKLSAQLIDEKFKN